MTDFNAYNQALEHFESLIPHQQSIFMNPTCTHAEVVQERGSTHCLLCGEKIISTLQHEREWRFYTGAERRFSSDPNRVQPRKIEDKSIYKDVDGMGFSEKIISDANEIFLEVMNGQTKRRKSRKGIVFACIFYAYKINENPQPYEDLSQLFRLSKKSALQGLKKVSLNTPKSSRIHAVQITPLHIVDNIMDNFNATQEQKEEVHQLYEKVKNKSYKLNRARPQSVAVGLTYYWIRLTKKDISIKDFTQITRLSKELTIVKNAKIISQILDTPDVI